MKRSFRGECHERVHLLEETMKKQKNGENLEYENLLAHVEKQGKNRKKAKVSTIDNNDENACFNSPYLGRTDERVLTEQSKTVQTRREMNRRRAKDNREQKKIMIRKVEERIILLKVDNERLRLECQIQRREIDQLRDICELSTSNTRFLNHTNIPSAPTTRLSNADILNINNRISSTNDNISDVLQALEYSNADIINSIVLRTSI